MKYRKSFVTNSSSSSYVVAIKRDVTSLKRAIMTAMGADPSVALRDGTFLNNIGHEIASYLVGNCHEIDNEDRESFSDGFLDAYDLVGISQAKESP